MMMPGVLFEGISLGDLQSDFFPQRALRQRQSARGKHSLDAALLEAAGAGTTSHQVSELIGLGALY